MRSSIRILVAAALLGSLVLGGAARADNHRWAPEVKQFIQKHSVKKNGLTFLSLNTFDRNHLGILGKLMGKSIGVGFNATYVGNGMPGHTEVFLGGMKSDFVGTRSANYHSMMDDTLHGLVVAVYASKTSSAVDAAQAQFKSLSSAINACNLRPFKMAGGTSTLVPDGKDQWKIINTRRKPLNRRVDARLVKEGGRTYLEAKGADAAGVKARAEVTPRTVDYKGQQVKGLILEGRSCASYVTRTLNQVLEAHPDSGLPGSIINTIAARQISSNIMSGNLGGQRKPDLILHLSAGEPPADVYGAALRVSNGSAD